MIKNTNFEKFNFILRAIYVLPQAVTGTIESLLAYRFERFPLKKSVLIDLAPIIQRPCQITYCSSCQSHKTSLLGIFPVQISAIIIVDPILIGLIVISVLEGLRSQRMSLFGILGRLSKNPPVLAVFAGPLMVALAIELPIYLAELVTFSAYAPRP